MTDKERVHGLCDECIQKIDWSLENHFKSVMDNFAFDDVLSCCIYGVYPRILIYKMKMQGGPYVAKALAKMLAERVLLYGGEKSFDCLVPVPSTLKKRLARGFNQAELLAKYASKELNLPVLKALIKVRETKSARLSTGLERRFLQQGAFGVSEKYKEQIQGKKVLLVDDVITTGSTADECARILKNYGADKVYVLCFASTAQA